MVLNGGSCVRFFTPLRFVQNDMTGARVASRGICFTKLVA